MSPRPERPLRGRTPFGKILTALILAAAAFCILSLGASDDSSAQSGTCGDSVSWNFSDGLLNITGTGAMYDYESPDDQPWEDFRGDITAISVGAGVTSIGKNVFYTCGSAASVTLPASLTSIGPCSFMYCTCLESISLPQGLTSIGDNAFREAGLTSVTIPNGVTSISRETFWTCVGLRTVVIPDSVMAIGFEAFSHCAFIKEMYVSSNLATLDDSAFDDVTLYDSDASTVLVNNVENLRGPAGVREN